MLPVSNHDDFVGFRLFFQTVLFDDVFDDESLVAPRLLDVASLRALEIL